MKRIIALFALILMVWVVNQKLQAMGESTLGQSRQSVTLAGISNTLGDTLQRGGGIAVNVLESGGKAVSGGDARVDRQAKPTPKGYNFPLPVKLEIKYEKKTYTVIIKDSGNQGTCPKFHTTVEAVISGSEGRAKVTKSICVGKSTALFFGSNALQWQNIIVAFANNPDYDPTKESNTLPFNLALSAWTSMTPPWNETRLITDPNTGRNYPNGGLKIVQGLPAWGGGDVPRAGFAHIAHIYNETPYIFFFERRDGDKVGKKFDFTELIPGSTRQEKDVTIKGIDKKVKVLTSGGSVAPFALAWLPKNKFEEFVSPDSALYLYPFITPENAQIVDPSLLRDQATRSVGSAANGSEPSDEELQKIWEEQKRSMPEETFSLIDDELYGMLNSDAIKNFLASKFYYKIYSNMDRSEVRIDKCDINTDDCKMLYTFKQSPITGNLPNFLRLVISQDAAKGAVKKGTLNFEITALPQNLITKK